MTVDTDDDDDDDDYDVTISNSLHDYYNETMGPFTCFSLVNCSISGVYLVTLSFTQASAYTGVRQLLCGLNSFHV